MARFFITVTSCFVFIYFTFILSRINICSASCTADHDCFPSGGRKCCSGECFNRKYCSNHCNYNGDCDISKRENCVAYRCTTEVRTLKPGQCRYSYQCDTLTEICQDGKCKKIKGVNEATYIPTRSTSPENSKLPASVLVGIIVPLVIIVVLIISVCFVFWRRQKKREQEEDIQRHQHQSEMQSVARFPLPSAPPLPLDDTFRGGGIPPQAPPSYNDVVKNTLSGSAQWDAQIYR